jgi:hypothetical protein
MAAPVRWILGIGGVPADKAAAIAELQTTAVKGKLLAAFCADLVVDRLCPGKELRAGSRPSFGTSTRVSQ